MDGWEHDATYPQPRLDRSLTVTHFCPHPPTHTHTVSPPSTRHRVTVTVDNHRLSQSPSLHSTPSNANAPHQTASPHQRTHIRTNDRIPVDVWLLTCLLAHALTVTQPHAAFTVIRTTAHGVTYYPPHRACAAVSVAIRDRDDKQALAFTCVPKRTPTPPFTTTQRCLARPPTANTCRCRWLVLDAARMRALCVSAAPTLRLVRRRACFGLRWWSRAVHWLHSGCPFQHTVFRVA